MATQLINYTVAGVPTSIDVPASLLLAVKTVYPAATVAYPFAALELIEPAPGGGKTNLTVRVTYPAN